MLFDRNERFLTLINSMTFPNDMIQRFISQMIDHILTTYSSHIPDSFVVNDKLLYTMIHDYGQQVSSYPFDGYYVHVGNQRYKLLLSQSSFCDYGIHIMKDSESSDTPLDCSKWKYQH